MIKSLIIGLADTCAAGEVNMGRNYVEAIRRGGHTAVVLPYSDNDMVCRKMLRGIDVLLLSGGGDIASSYFGQEPTSFDSIPNADRDAFEIRLVGLACKMNKSIVGICRGLQVINVALGGTLWQDMTFKREHDQVQMNTSISLPYVDHQRPDKKWEGVHSVLVNKESRLYDVLKLDNLWVNSTHHQAIRDLGRDLEVVAQSEDGVIEAIESKTSPIAAVQWHPERLVGQPFDTLFKYIKKWTGG